MRRALVAGLVGLALLGVAALVVGVGMRTWWLPEDSVSAVAEIDEPGVLVRTAPGLLEARPGPVEVSAQAPDGGPVLLAVGRERDVEAYAEGLAGAVVTGFEAEQPQQLTSEPTLAAEPADAAPLGDPAASDLWVQRQTGTGTASLTYDQPDGRFLLVAAGDGTSPAPERLTLTWPQEVRTPWATPLVVIGSVLLLAALAGALLLVLRRRTTPSAQLQHAGTTRDVR